MLLLVRKWGSGRRASYGERSARTDSSAGGVVARTEKRVEMRRVGILKKLGAESRRGDQGLWKGGNREADNRTQRGRQRGRNDGDWRPAGTGVCVWRGVGVGAARDRRPDPVGWGRGNRTSEGGTGRGGRARGGARARGAACRSGSSRPALSSGPSRATRWRWLRRQRPGRRRPGGRGEGLGAGRPDGPARCAAWRRRAPGDAEAGGE